MFRFPWDRRPACPALSWDRRPACPALACFTGDANDRAVLKQTIAAAPCPIWNRSHPSDAKVCMPILISTGETPNRATEKHGLVLPARASGIGGVLQNTAGIESHGVVMRTGQAGRLSHDGHGQAGRLFHDGHGQAGRLSHDGHGQAGRLFHGTASAVPTRIARMGAASVR